MSEALLALGANEGDPLQQLRLAVRQIREHVKVESVSTVYRTEPVGQLDQPDFLNLVCRGQTELGAQELLRALLRIERGLGRERRSRNGPRRIDIDVLTIGNLVLDSEDLVVPHPRLHERTFVLIPLAEIAPEWRHPVLGGTAQELLSNLQHVTRVERLGALEEIQPPES